MLRPFTLCWSPHSSGYKWGYLGSRLSLRKPIPTPLWPTRRESNLHCSVMRCPCVHWGHSLVGWLWGSHPIILVYWDIAQATRVYYQWPLPTSPPYLTSRPLPFSLCPWEVGTGTGWWAQQFQTMSHMLPWCTWVTFGCFPFEEETTERVRTIDAWSWMLEQMDHPGLGLV